MSRERYNQIIDEAYMNYITELSKTSYLLLKERLDKEGFISVTKQSKKFSEKWGLKIEERELSLGERGELFRKEHPNKSVNDFAPNGMEVQSLNHQLNTRYNNANIPTKLITITYKNEKIEIYE